MNRRFELQKRSQLFIRAYNERLSVAAVCGPRFGCDLDSLVTFLFSKIDAAIENVGNVELLKLEKNLSILATTASVAPMIGFFGTVTGMIQSFYGMATAATVTPGALANGIYLAFISTAIGLAIGIFAYFAYNFLVTKVDHVLYNMEQVTTEFMDMLQEPNK